MKLLLLLDLLLGCDESLLGTLVLDIWTLFVHFVLILSITQLATVVLVRPCRGSLGVQLEIVVRIFSLFHLFALLLDVLS